MKEKVYINQQTLLEIIVFLFLECVLVWLVSSKNYLLYVTDKLLPWLWIGIIIFALIILSMIPLLFIRKRRNHSLYLWVICIPAMIFILPKGSLSLAQTNTANAIKAQTQNITIDEEAKIDNYVVNYPSSTRKNEDLNQEDKDGYPVQLPSGNMAYLQGIDTVAKTLVISNDEFYPWLIELFTHPSKYLDYTISITGFVFTGDETLDSSQFLLSRQMMTCCVADISNAGIVANYAYKASLEEESWILATGSIQIEEINGQVEPVFYINQVLPTAPPDQPYVYPF